MGKYTSQTASVRAYASATQRAATPSMTCVHGMEFSFHNFNRVFHNLADCGVEGCGGPLCPMVPYGGCGSCVEVFKTRKPLGP